MRLMPIFTPRARVVNMKLERIVTIRRNGQ